MYRILILGFICIYASVLYSMEEQGKNGTGWVLLYEERVESVPAVDPGLRIAVDHDGANDVVSPLTSPPFTVPLTPAQEPTGTSPLCPSTPNTEELEGLVSPLTQDRTQHFGTNRRRSSSVAYRAFDLEERKRRCRKRCYALGSCIGVSVIAAAIYVIQRYAF